MTPGAAPVLSSRQPPVTFACEFCGVSKTEPAAWYRKRVRHFCSRACANKHQAKLAEEVRGGPVDRKAYEKGYWAKPENAARRRADTRVAVRRRMEALGDSYKKMVLARCRGRAKEKGIPCTISIADFEIPSHCPVLGVPLQVGVGQGGQPFSPSLDRIDSSKGYEPRQRDGDLEEGELDEIGRHCRRGRDAAGLDETRPAAAGGQGPGVTCPVHCAAATTTAAAGARGKTPWTTRARS